jgi:hypothetical protein
MNSGRDGPLFAPELRNQFRIKLSEGERRTLNLVNSE